MALFSRGPRERHSRPTGRQLQRSVFHIRRLEPPSNRQPMRLPTRVSRQVPGAGKVPYNPFAITKQVNQTSPPLAPTGGGKNKKGTANGGVSGGSGGFSDVVGVSQSKDTNVSEFRAGSDKPLQIVPKGRPAAGSRVSTQAATLPANAVQANPNPPKRKKPAAPPHQP